MKPTSLLPILALPFALSTACGGEEDGDNGGTGGGDVQPAKMVQLPAGFSIDSTEVTRAQYAAWLATKPSGGQPAECSWNTSFTPGCDWPPGDKGDHPVVCVDWCDAYAYCQGVGKRLCGAIGGGPEVDGAASDASKSEWFNACSSAGAHPYPYGDTYDETLCVGAHHGLDGPDAVRHDGCQSSVPGFEGVFDLSGNVSEWVNSCGDSADGTKCGERGGDFALESAGLDCRSVLYDSPTFSAQMIGFRCCAD